MKAQIQITRDDDPYTKTIFLVSEEIATAAELLLEAMEKAERESDTVNTWSSEQADAADN